MYVCILSSTRHFDVQKRVHVHLKHTDMEHDTMTKHIIRTGSLKEVQINHLKL
jgi:hypothetical protein